MSLFQANEWWSAKGVDTSIDAALQTGSDAAEADECGHKCLLLANIDNAEDGSDKIITGSFHGWLRIWKPGATAAANNEPGDVPPSAPSRIGDLALETRLDGPIIALAAGRFSRRVQT